ncbi:conserved Plasmodium protein, unknown function [Plasmodium malariae]|uniref:Uncharacterized protein n=1 Tax=Plasmodium malariae TaxID=5858 RepID=A0A1D3TF42_PLAMA|nr:conserved Plasmodium protein, unknown function [Plasmodium malariae]SCP03570.1 conserved Plasmodium protein, unknown function [Plasmodium malariae]
MSSCKTIKSYGEVKKRKKLCVLNDELEEAKDYEQEDLDPELHDSLRGCIENDMKNIYFDGLTECDQNDYSADEDNFDKDDLSEETKRKKYYVYGRNFSDKDFDSEHVHKYYQHLPIYFDNPNVGSTSNFKKMYESNKIENLERNIREEDLYYPSVPINWKLYVCLFFDKKYNYENEEEKNIYDRFNKNIRHKYVLEFLSWVKLSTRIYQNTSKILMLFNLKKNNNIYGNILFFTSLNLHYANMFMKSNPYIKLGLCEELYLYSYESNNDHFLLGNFPNLFLQKNYLFIKFFNPQKLKEINSLYEKHMRFYITSNMIFKLGILKKVHKDNLKDIFLTTHQYLPITEDQTKSILSKFNAEFELLERCTAVQLDEHCRIRSITGAGERDGISGSGSTSSWDSTNSSSRCSGKSEHLPNDTEEGENQERYNSSCVAELNIVNCRDEEEAQEFLEKDPYTRCCFYESIFFSEVREVVPHIKYGEGYMPKMMNPNLKYKYELDTNLNPTECLEDKPEYLENRSMAEKKLANHEKVDFDILDTFIKLKYTNKEVEYEHWDVKESDTGVNGKFHANCALDMAEMEKKNLYISEKSLQGGILEKRRRGTASEMDRMDTMDRSDGNDRRSRSGRSSGAKVCRVKIVDYDNDYIDYICNVQRNKILYVKKNGKDKETTYTDSKSALGSNKSNNIYDILREDMKNPNIYKKKDILLIDNTLQFFDHFFFKDYLSGFVYISLPPGEYIEDAYLIKDEKNYDFTMFNNSLATQDDFLKRQNYQPRFLKGIWLKKEQSKILFYDKQNNALLFGTGIDKTFSWDKQVDDRVMKRALINMEIAMEKIRKGSSIIQDDITVHQETDRTIKEYTDEYTSVQKRFTSIHNHLKSSEGLEYLNPHIWEKTTDEHKKLMLDKERVQKLHSKFLKKLELYKASVDDDPFIQKAPSESDILSHSDKVEIHFL